MPKVWFASWSVASVFRSLAATGKSGIYPPQRKPGVTPQDPVYRIAEAAQDFGGTLDARQADDLIYRA